MVNGCVKRVGGEREDMNLRLVDPDTLISSFAVAKTATTDDFY